MSSIARRAQKDCRPRDTSGIGVLTSFRRPARQAGRTVTPGPARYLTPH